MLQRRVNPPAPGVGGSAPTAQEFVDRGEKAFRNGDYAGAVYAWRHALVDTPENPVLTLMLAQALFATGNFDDAAGATQSALQQLPSEQWGVVVTHYRELYGQAKDYTAQLRALETAIREKPDQPTLRFLAGYHFGYLGFVNPSIEQLDKALKLTPGDALARQLRDEMRSKLLKPVPPPPPAPGISNEAEAPSAPEP
jgi:tetratricopeptide (TPR) repeat protein